MICSTDKVSLLERQLKPGSTFVVVYARSWGGNAGLEICHDLRFLILTTSWIDVSEAALTRGKMMAYKLNQLLCHYEHYLR